MNDSSRPPLPVSATALLRYSVVAEVEALVLRGWPAVAAVRHVAGASHVDLDGRPVRISVRTLQRWRAAWASGKLAALEPRQRTRTTTSQALSVELVAFLRTEKRCDARASAPELVRRARERGIVPAGLKIDRTTVRCACRRLGLPTRRRPHKREGDTRRWRYAERMQCVLADGKHFRAGAARLRRVARHVLDGRRWVQHQRRMIELAEVDPQANATEPRGSGSAPQPPAGEDGEELPNYRPPRPASPTPTTCARWSTPRAAIAIRTTTRTTNPTTRNRTHEPRSQPPGLSQDPLYPRTAGARTAASTAGNSTGPGDRCSGTARSTR